MRKLLLFLMLVIITTTFAVEFEPMLESFEDEMDIVFVMDTSGSMGGELSGMRSRIIGMVDALSEDSVFYRMGGVTFADGVGIWDFDDMTAGFQLTENFSEFISAVNATGVSGGGDGPECSMDAIYAAAFEIEDTAGMAPERPRVIIHYTDAPYHERGDGTSFSSVLFTEVYDEIIAAGIPVFEVTCAYDGIADDYYEMLAEDSGGEWYPMTVSWEDILADVYETVGTYFYFSCEISGVGGMELSEVELTGMSGISFVSPDIHEISFVEGRDAIRVGWLLDYDCDAVRRELEMVPYTVTMRTADEQEYTYNDYLYFEALDINENIDFVPVEMNLSAYPNPFNSAVEIKFDNASKIEIFDTKGNIVESFDANSSGVMLWHPSVEINSGVFIVRSSSTEGTYTDTKISYIK